MEATEDRGDVIVTCEVDLLMASASPEEAALHDWKSGRKRWTASTAKESFQFGTFYPWMVLRVYPQLQQVTTYVHMPRLYHHTNALIFKRSDMPAAEGRILSAVRWAMSDEHPAWPTSEKCELCPCTQACPRVNPKQLDMAKAPSPGSYLRDYIASKKRLAKMKKQLDAHVKKHGDIVVVDKEQGNVAYGTQAPKDARFSAKDYKPNEEDGDE